MNIKDHVGCLVIVGRWLHGNGSWNPLLSDGLLSDRVYDVTPLFDDKPPLHALRGQSFATFETCTRLVSLAGYCRAFEHE